jgi:hypothetical protein
MRPLPVRSPKSIARAIHAVRRAAARPPWLVFIAALSLAGAIAGCNAPTEVTPPPAQASPTIPPPSPTPPPTTIRLIRADSLTDPTFVDLLQELRALAAEAGFTLDEAAGLTSPIGADTRLVISYAGAADTASLVQDHPQLQVVAIGEPDLAPAPNLLVIGAEGFAWDRQGFAAGYAAALATPGFRVGVLAPQDLPEAESAAAAFLKGAVFYCGLCNPAEPPYVDYPLLVPIDSQGSDLETAISSLAASGVRALYVPDQRIAETAVPLAAQAGAHVIGPALTDESLRASWLLSVRADPASALRSAWPDLLAGLTSGSRDMPLRVADAQAESLSPGKLAFLDEMLVSLERGEIATGAEPTSLQLGNVSGG